MKVSVVSMDTRGGIQPYVALALELQKRGHSVRLVAPQEFASMIQAWGVRHVGLSGSIEATLREAGGATEGGAIASMRFARQHLLSRIVQWTREVLAGSEDIEVMVGGIGGLVVGGSVAEKLRIPFVEAHLQPVGEATSTFPGVLVPQMPSWLGVVGNRLSHALTDLGIWAPFREAMQRARKEVLGLGGSLREGPTHLPVLYGISPQVIAPPHDWSSRRKFTGYWTLPPEHGWKPSPALEAFLAEGEAPVCLGFGSMTSEDPQALTRLVLDAVRRAGVRAVLLTGWGALSERSERDVLVEASVPHEWLFPRMRAVVHHGGAGTTGAAFRAGVPALVVPFSMDQPFWGTRVHALGCGPAPIARKRLTTEGLTEALRTMATDRAMQARAAQIGERIREENGVGTAAELLERTMG